MQENTDPKSSPVAAAYPAEPAQQADAIKLLPEPEEMQVATSEEPEAVHSETVRDSTESETQTDISRAEAGTQTTEMAYPIFWDDAGLIGNELEILRGLLKSFAQSMTSLRNHGEARSEL